MTKVSVFKFTGRILGMLMIIVGTTLSYLLLARNRASLPARAAWLQRWSRRTLRLIDLEVAVSGPVPPPGLVASNHMSYIDVLVLSSVRPQVFLAKSEVKRWPLFGAFARWSGSVFIDRRKRSEVSAKTSQFAEAVDAGLPVVVFLEGTTSDGSSVRPFRTALLEPAIQAGWPVTPCTLHYDAVGAKASDTICYHGEMTLVPHLVMLFRRVVRSKASVVFGEPVTGEPDRKQMGADLHRQVVRVKQRLAKGSGLDL
jgi:1-acyl-sn-glycerol-3-phosphate acyltransferase